jgi:hypothetical protein
LKVRSKGLKDKFLDGQAALCYHHQHDKCLARCSTSEEEGKGLKMRRASTARSRITRF